MNLKQIAQKIGGYIQSKTQDDEGWIRQNKFTPVKQVQQMGQNLNAWGNIAKQGIQNQVEVQKQDFNKYAWQPLKANPVLGPSLNRFEQAIPSLKTNVSMDFKEKNARLNPFQNQQKKQQSLQDVQNYRQSGQAWKDTKNVASAGLTAYGLVKTPLAAVIGGAVINPIVKMGTNIYENKKGEELNRQLIENGQQPQYNKKRVTEGVVNSIPEGAGQGLANAGTTKLTNYMVQSLSNLIPILKPLTEQAIKQGAPVVTDTVKQAVKKLFQTGGKRIIKAAVLETAVETPIWATLTQTEQETYLQAIEREAVQNLVMNIGMAGVNTVVDSKALLPIVKKSIDTAATNYWKNASSPEGLEKQGGFLNIYGDVIDGTQRTKLYDQSINTLKENPNATQSEKIKAQSNLVNLAKQVLDPEEFKRIVGKKKGIYAGGTSMIDDLIDVLGQKIYDDVPNNTGYQEPFTLRNLLRNDEPERGGMDLTDKTKPFPQSQISPEVKTGEVSTPQNELIKKIDNTPTGNFIETKRQYLDLGGNQQGKRSGGMVKGGMSDIGLKYKSTDSYGIKVPEPLDQITAKGKTIGEEIQLISNRGQLSANSYAKARNAGLSHDDAINFALYKTGVEEPFLKKTVGAKLNLATELPQGSQTGLKPAISDTNNIIPQSKNNRTAFKDLGISSTPWKKDVSQISPESKGIIKLKDNDLVKTFDETIKTTESPKVKTSIDTRKVGLPDQLQATKLQTELPKTNKVLPQDIIPTKNSSPEEVAASIPKRLDNFIEKTLGYSTKAPEGGVRQASGYTKALRGLQENISTKVETGMASENKLVRGAATTMQNFFRGLGMSPERQAASMSLRGEMGVANERAFNVMDTLYKSLGNDKASLERINAVLDPNISKIKVSFDQLNPTEKQVYGLIREGLDLVHDTSYANGHISAEVYATNKGKYTPRLYEVTEIPAEVNKFVTQGKKIANDLYKQRKDIDAWKQDNSLNDPVYALGKRLSQVETNSAIKKYTDFLASNPRFISDVERPGFTKLSDSPAYGNLSGKYVLNSAAEDLKGFFFANQGVQNLYDAFRAYDRLPIRQLQKKLLTVFNPTTNVGNIVSDQVFGWVTGVNPLTLNKNVIKLKTNPGEYKQISDYLMKKGITGTDITRTDFVNKLGSIDDLASGVKPGKIKLATNKIQSFYGGTDDVYKAAAFKSLLDKGFSLEEATRKVGDGFQNYANVGKFYDLAAKTPIIGKPFIKFQGDLIRIIKNGAVNNPLGLISFLGTLKAISYLSSKASGESDEDRKTRETRFAAPMIPGLNIPLTWQTPIGEINVARYISPFYANNETTNILSNMIPGIPNIDTKKDVASNVAMNVNDPLVSPLVQLAVNRDFRGKPISDPNENKYQPSNLTPGEKTGNQAKFLGRSYLPPPVNSAIDVNSAIQGKPNMYGTPQTVGQSVARLGGIKISQYGPEEVQKIRDKDAEYQQYKNESLDKQISSVLKQEVKGDITAEQSAKRIQNLEKQKKDVVIEKTKTMDEKKKDIAVDLGREKVRETGEITEVQGVVLYPDKQLDTETGEYKTVVKSIDINKPINKPKLTGNKEVDKKMTSFYNSKITSRISDIVKLVELEKLDADTAEKMIAELKKTKIGGTKKSKKITIKTSSPKALPKITLKISSPVSRIKLKSAPKVGLTKTNNRKYTIKA